MYIKDLNISLFLPLNLSLSQSLSLSSLSDRLSMDPSEFQF